MLKKEENMSNTFSPQDVALFLQEFNAPDIFMGVFAKSKCPRLTVSINTVILLVLEC